MLVADGCHSVFIRILSVTEWTLAASASWRKVLAVQSASVSEFDDRDQLLDVDRAQITQRYTDIHCLHHDLRRPAARRHPVATM